MQLISTVFAAAADEVDISNLPNPATKITGTNLSAIFSENLLNIVFVIVGLIFFANVVMAGWDYMLSSGDPKRISAATTRLINSIIGLVLAMVAFVVVRIVLQVLGLGNLI